MASGGKKTRDLGCTFHLHNSQHMTSVGGLAWTRQHLRAINLLVHLRRPSLFDSRLLPHTSAGHATCNVGGKVNAHRMQACVHAMQCDDGACFSYPGVVAIVRASRMIFAIYTCNEKSIHSPQQHQHCDHARRIRSDGVQAGANNNNAMSPPSAAETYAATSPVRLSWCCV